MAKKIAQVKLTFLKLVEYEEQDFEGDKESIKDYIYDAALDTLDLCRDLDEIKVRYE